MELRCVFVVPPFWRLESLTLGRAVESSRAVSNGFSWGPRRRNARLVDLTLVWRTSVWRGLPVGRARIDNRARRGHSKVSLRRQGKGTAKINDASATPHSQGSVDGRRTSTSSQTLGGVVMTVWTCWRAPR